ncbi:MAG: indolepyruvate oxidoreductase subunit beta family protein [Rudaea sp.]
MTQPIAILIGALGGQGGGVLAEWLVDAATRAGYVAQATSIPGVAQRTGATTYYVEVFPEPRSALGERVPVLGLYPVPGHVALVVASELLEAARVIQAGYVTPDRTLLIASTSRTLTTAEKMALGDGRVDSGRLLEAARAQSRQLVSLDMDAIARSAGTVVSSVMLGAIAASGVLPVARGVFEDVVRAGGVGVEPSLRGFAQAFAAALAQPPTSVAPGPAPVAMSPDARREATAFPEPAREMVALGYDRVVEFQDVRYGELFIERLRAIDRAERAHGVKAPSDACVLRETARFLALWMAFDDIVRVASLKSARTRLARVRSEIGATPDDVVRIVDHFKPGVPEFAGLLPPALAGRLVRFDARRQARGREPLGWPMHLRTHTVHGFALLRMLAALRPLRRLGARYADEQRAIERWLHAVELACTQDPALGYEVALCGRLVKGYGATNVRGKANLLHILEHVLVGSAGRPTRERAAAVRSAREAALADEGGKALDAELARQGAPARPVVAQPIRFVSRRAAAARPQRVH